MLHLRQRTLISLLLTTYASGASLNPNPAFAQFKSAQSPIFNHSKKSEQSKPDLVVPLSFTAFITSVKNAKYSKYRRSPDVRVIDGIEFKAMQSHILKRYSNLHPTKTTVDQSGVWDYIPAHEQRGYKDSLVAPSTPGDHSNVTNKLSPVDEIPMLRMTLETMTKFPTLNDFLRGGKALPPTP